MTTTVTITNNGPGRVRVRHRNVSKSARTVDHDAHEIILEAPGSTGATGETSFVYDTRKIIIEEVDE